MPRPPSHDSRTPDRATHDQTVDGGADTVAWLAAAALMVSPEGLVAAAEDQPEVAGPADEGERPGQDTTMMVASSGSHGSGAFGPPEWDGSADGVRPDFGPLPDWQLAGRDGDPLPAAPFHHSESAYDAFEWGGHYFPTAGTGSGPGGVQVASAGDLIFLDLSSYARPDGAGKGGGKGGHGGDGGDGGSADPAALSEYLSGDPGGYNILIDFKGSWTATLQGAFTGAADLLSDIIRGDLADVFFRGKVIDDIRITAELVEIDGPGGILGQAGPTAIRTADYLPATGMMEFDRADADTFFGLGLWDDIVLHEMIHTIGFGTVWDYMGLVAGAGTADPMFTGTQATLTYQSLFGADDATGVPLEQDGGPGTVESHWDEETFGAEIMTGYLDLAGTYLSGVTVASLADLGYETASIAAVA